MLFLSRSFVNSKCSFSTRSDNSFELLLLWNVLVFADISSYPKEAGLTRTKLFDDWINLMCQVLNDCCYKQELTYLKKKVSRIITPQPKITQLTQLFILIRFTSIYFVNISLMTLPASLMHIKSSSGQKR
jgi:hypothetical protein